MVQKRFCDICGAEIFDSAIVSHNEAMEALKVPLRWKLDENAERDDA